MSPEQHARAVVSLMAATDPADVGMVPAATIHALITYCVGRLADLSRLGDYGLRRMADALVNELGIPDPPARP